MIRAILLIAALTAAAPEVKNPVLADGIRLYSSQNYSEALVALTKAIERPGSRADAARIHLYIGLIQHRYKLREDAEASFARAIEFDRSVRLPRNTPGSARKLFRKIQKDKFGEEEPSDAGETKKKKKKRRGDDGVRYRDERSDESFEDDEEPPPNGFKGDAPPRSSGDEAERADERRAVSGDVSGQSDRWTGRPDVGSTQSEARLRDGADGRVVDDDDDGEGSAFRPRGDYGDRRILPPTAQVRARRGSSVGGWVAIGIGAAAVATGITLGVIAKYNSDASKAEEDSGRSQALSNAASAQRTGAFVSFGVAGVSLGLGAIFFLTD